MIRSWYKGRRVSRALLLRHLSSKQQRIFRLCRCLRITGPSGRRYTILPVRSYSVITKIQSYCLVPKQKLPLWDQMLATKLLIEANEEYFLREAQDDSFGWIFILIQLSFVSTPFVLIALWLPLIAACIAVCAIAIWAL